jgi:hypothetical protein
MAYQHQGGRRCRRECQLHEATWARQQLRHPLALPNCKESRREAGKTAYVTPPLVTRTSRTVLIIISAGKNYVLRSWPEGYHMYCHYKGKQSSPRQDLYLLGSHSPILSCSDIIMPDMAPRGVQDQFTQNVSAPFPSLCLTQYGS